MLRNVTLGVARQSSRHVSLTRARTAVLASSVTQTTTSLPSRRTMSSAARISQLGSHLQASPTNARAMSSSASASAAAPSSQKRSGGGDDGTEPKVITTHNGSSTIITLNRPKALNAIDTEMVQLIDEGIDSAATENHIILRGVGRALCSGGDVMAVVTAADSADAAKRQEALTFFKNEFNLDYKIATLDTLRQPRIFISVMDGITMGGGVGLSVSAPIRIATEKTMFAMPETGIGYWPDVGVTRNLSRLDGQVGVYLGMTGARISGEEAYLTGLATHFIPSSTIDDALRRFSALPRESSGEHISDTLNEFCLDPFNPTAHGAADKVKSTSAFVGARRIALDYAFGRDSVEKVVKALEEISSGSNDTEAAKALARPGVTPEDEGVAQWAGTTLKTLHAKSPRSLKVTFKAVKAARNHNISQAFLADMRLATVFCDFGVGRDFFEGVTFTLTKDPQTGKRREGIAKWQPAAIEDVNDDDVERLFFGPLEDAKAAGLTMDVPELPDLPNSSGEPKQRRRQQSDQRGIGPLSWERDYNRLALPSEAECEALREGSHPSAGDYELNAEEMLRILRNTKSDKLGLEFKLNEWLARRAKMGGAHV